MKSYTPGRNRTEIVIFHLLSAGRCMTEYSAAGHNEVRTCIEQCIVDHKVLLLGTEGSYHVSEYLYRRTGKLW